MPKSLRTFLSELHAERPDELKTISRALDPIFEVSAVIEKLQ